jgi:tripartite-type tricarboxylate transporter receptor subunit TctC
LGGTQHLVWEMLQKVAGVSFIHVPYKGGAPATADLQGGHVDMMFEQMYAATPALKAGRLRVLAIASATRSPQLPDVPTMAEAGVPGFGSVENWQGFIAPANTPKSIIQLLNKVTNQALTDPSIKQRILDEGNDVGGGTPEQFGQLIASEAKRWGQLVRSAKITVN